MWSFAKESIRHHRGGFAGVFVAVFLCAALITAMGVLIESGLRGGTAADKLRGADVVVGAPQSLPVVEDMDAPLSERVLLPENVVSRIADVPGVEQAVGTVTVPLADDAGRSLSASAWDSAVLAPYTLTSGEEPRTASEVVVDGSFGVSPGDRLVLSHGGEPSEYTVSGIAEAEKSDGSPAVFLSSAGTAALWPHGDTFATVGVIADGSVAPKELAADIEAGVDGVVTYTGDRRGDVEDLGGSAARSTLLLLSGSLAGVALMTAVFVTAGTLSLSILARRREFAMLRAVGAGSGQTLGMIIREVLLVSGAAAVLGAAPGFGLAYFLGAQFTAGGVIPEDFALAYGPLPALAAVALSVTAAVGASLVSARGTVRMSPTTALRESVTEAAGLGRGRKMSGLVLLAAGLVAAMLPLAIPGTGGLAIAASSVLLLIIGAGMLGPWIVAGVLRLVKPLLGRNPSASLALALANASAFPRRLAGGIIPLALAIALGSVQLFMPTTVETEAERQSRDGMVADYMVTAPGSGISADLAEEVSTLPAVDTATPVAHSAVLADLRFLGTEDGLESYGIQGVDPRNLDSTLDLGVGDGGLDGLSEPETVALSVDLARESGVGVGDQFAFHYGDGTETSAVVVATYSRGLGFGDVTVANDTLLQHTTAGLNDYLLVSAAPGTNDTAMADQLEDLGLTVVDRESAGAAGAADRKAQSWVNIVAMLVLLGYVGLSVVNSLVMATARRRPELMLLRSLGASDRQLRRMTGAESLLLVVAAVVLGTVLAIPPLMGIAVNVSGLPMPTIQPLVYLAIAGAAAAIGFGSVAVATRAALRPEARV
ncbi:ABC transporter permease [Arthrobacter sp. zg-Y1143]|uniref:ABC transporter permease n=1 Tax=Arthrobacter sp. zg-Y1143 TaxID=3049065 RepID=UPI0024C3482C|nr:ABC transporter permease [Arthrobacter sp. zg-Y1143]MDK1329142.1 FtsX-like permease family protein [Arthrobacter sp. zg-Y1143]